MDIAKKRNPQPISPEPCENIVIHANFLNANIAPRLPRLSFIPGNRGQNDFMTRLKMTRLPVFIDYCHNIPCWRGTVCQSRDDPWLTILHLPEQPCACWGKSLVKLNSPCSLPPTQNFYFHFREKIKVLSAFLTLHLKIILLEIVSLGTILGCRRWKLSKKIVEELHVIFYIKLNDN